LSGSGGLVLECPDYGGIVTRLLAPDRTGHLADVVLGFDTLDDYRAPQPYFGAIIGRVAGRITGGLYDHEYHLAINNDPNDLHGGLCGFNTHLWSVAPASRPDGAPSLRLTRISPDGEEGHPGTVTVSISCTVTADNTFLIESKAFSDAPTPFSLTHHSYFNLGGHDSGPVSDHILQIFGDHYAPTDSRMTLLGRRELVIPANDLRSPRRLGDLIPGLHQHHGDLDILPAANDSSSLRTAARVAELNSGRILTVDTNESCLQFYAGASLDGSLAGKFGRRYVRHAGLCLECEGNPDAPNVPAFANSTLALAGPPVKPSPTVSLPPESSLPAITSRSKSLLIRVSTPKTLSSPSHTLPFGATSASSTSSPATPTPTAATITHWPQTEPTSGSSVSTSASRPRPPARTAPRHRFRLRVHSQTRRHRHRPRPVWRLPPQTHPAGDGLHRRWRRHGSLRAHLSWLFETDHTDRRVSFWYGARSKPEIFYEDCFQNLAAAHPNFAFHVALSSPLPEDNWTGPAGFIYTVVEKQYLRVHANPTAVEYYLCGPPMMVKPCTKMLADLGVFAHQIAVDEF